VDAVSNINRAPGFNGALGFLDKCAMRCVQSPFKYLDDFEEIAQASYRSLQQSRVEHHEKQMVRPLSPLVCVLGEQWKYLGGSTASDAQDQTCVAKWLSRLLENLCMLGEHSGVLEVISMRLVSTNDNSAKLF